MPFINSSAPKDSKQNKDSAYLEVTDDRKTVRPGLQEPESTWVHRIPSVKVKAPNGKDVQIRGYRTEACTSTNKSGAGCRGCTTPDPLWHLLTEKDKFNKNGKRVDFPKTVVHVLPVVEVVDGSVKIMKGGNQLFEKMGTWLGSQSDQLKDLRRCNWQVWKVGAKGSLTTKYYSDRDDASPYSFTPEQLTNIASVLEKAKNDLQPGDLEEWQTFIKGVDADMAAGVTAPAADPAPWASPQTTTVTTPVTVTASNPEDQKAALLSFSEWLSKQPEYSNGSNVVVNLVPALREHLNGDISYNKLDRAGLERLQAFLANRLATMRGQ